ncbi:alpha/beta hydrolase [Streptomyces sp. MJP52]|uniref:alpha/beta fold hydrolase n=1 Tax=Streptomyces sp. MJP52 TaxID=2940555 RepID=UPI00247361FD|nr:alpha/beta hydrolase [Streptomyces sp. MJP52]MDH6228645.1 pimeloyl-ACP methyl ester carboxylesterase [Streptomyces sp. MJP52]
MTSEEPSAALLAYRRLDDEVYRCYEQGRLEDGIRLLTAPPAELRPWRAELAYLLACLQGAAGRPGEALETLCGALAAGGWWDPAVLEGEEDFAEVRRLPGFPPLREEAARRWEEGRRTTREHDLLVRPGTPSVRGVLLALHGAEESERDAVRAWRPALRAGFTVLAVRSSWRTSPNYRTWPRGPRASEALDEVDAAVAAHAGELEGRPLFLAGFSAGGRVALRWALSRGRGAVAGVVAVAPAISLDELPDAPDAPDALDVLAVTHLVVGADDDLLDDVRELAGHLPGCRLEVVEGTGHEVPAGAVGRVLGDWAGAATAASGAERAAVRG